MRFSNETNFYKSAQRSAGPAVRAESHANSARPSTHHASQGSPNTRQANVRSASAHLSDVIEDEVSQGDSSVSFIYPSGIPRVDETGSARQPRRRRDIVTGGAGGRKVNWTRAFQSMRHVLDSEPASPDPAPINLFPFSAMARRQSLAI